MEKGNFKTPFVQAVADFSHSKKEEANRLVQKKGLIIMGIQQTGDLDAEYHGAITGDENILRIGFSQLFQDPVMNRIVLEVLKNPKLNGGMIIEIYPPFAQGKA